MSIQVTCPAGHTLKVGADWAGRAGLCPVCKAPIHVPGKAEQVGAPQSAAKVTTDSTKSFDSTRPQAAPPVRTRTHTKPLPPAPPRSLAPAAHPVASEPAVLPTQAPAAPPPLPATAPVSAKALAAAAVDAALAIDDSIRETPHFADLPSLEPITAAVPSPPPLMRHTASRGDLDEAAVKPAAPAETPLARPVERSDSPDTAHHRTRALRGYVPDPDKRWTVYYLSAGMAVFSLFCLMPVFRHWNLGEAPAWARAVWLVSILQLAYVAWAISVPDWSTLWVSMIVFTVVAAGYGLAMALALTTPLDQAIPLDMTDIRRQAPLWSGCVVLLAFLLAYLCGRAAWRWQKTFELVHA